MELKKALLIFAALVILIVGAMAVFFGQSGGTERKVEKKSETMVAQDIADPSFIASKIAREHLVVKATSSFNVATDINSYFSKVKPDAVTEMIFRDENNSLQEAKAVLRMSQITIPETISAGAEMKMYIFKKETDLGFSEALVIKNNKNAEENKNAMRKWEESMIYDLRNFILIGEKYDLMKVSDVRTFSDSYYRNGRFANFSKGAYVTLDYVVADDYIVIGNSISVLNEIVSNMYESKLLSE